MLAGRRKRAAFLVWGVLLRFLAAAFLRAPVGDTGRESTAKRHGDAAPTVH